MRMLIYALIVLLAIAHQDFWWRSDSRTLVLGFLPVSLAYHVGVSIAACLLWGLACRFCWPADVDVADDDAWAPPAGRKAGH
ncbi:hypothetical protein RAS1_38370 [Phycisphaerae bacterium RAS1]|nr:hypothetical protein RAS1_38370 [Phycisphaerae bacterium RAS1]